MPNVKKFRIDFYHVVCENGTFEDFVNSKNRASFFQQPFVQWPYQVIMDVFEETQAYVCGNLTKVKMDDIDPKYNIRTYTASSLDLEEDEGIPTGCVFLYLKNQETLFLQVAKSGVSPNQFCDFFEDMTESGKIELSFVLSEEAFQRLASYNYISKLQIAIRGLESGYILGDGNNSPKTVLRKMQELNANNINIEISKGHRPTGLNTDSVKTFARQLYRIMSNAADDGASIRVTGREGDEDEMTTIDLIISRYKQFIQVDTAADSRLNSDLYTGGRLAALKELVNPVGRDLRKLFNANR